MEINSKIKEIISNYSYEGKYVGCHIKYEDLTDKTKNYGDYTVLLVTIEQEWDEKGAKHYLFLDHKGSVIIWELDEEFNIIKKEG